MTRKVVEIGPSPRRGKDPGAAVVSDAWVQGRGTGVKRFTLELDPDQHQRLKMEAARSGRSMADIVREKIDDACPA